MKKFYFLSLLLTALAMPAYGEVSDVRSGMKLINRYTNELARAGNTEDFLKATKALREVSAKTREIKPSGLDDTEFKGYQQGMQHFIDVVTQTEKLAEEGKLEEARVLSRELQNLKKEYHSQYKK